MASRGLRRHCDNCIDLSIGAPFWVCNDGNCPNHDGKGPGVVKHAVVPSHKVQSKLLTAKDLTPEIIEGLPRYEDLYLGVCQGKEGNVRILPSNWPQPVKYNFVSEPKQGFTAGGWASSGPTAEVYLKGQDGIFRCAGTYHKSSRRFEAWANA